MGDHTTIFDVAPISQAGAGFPLPDPRALERVLPWPSNFAHDPRHPAFKNCLKRRVVVVTEPCRVKAAPRPLGSSRSYPAVLPRSRAAWLHRGSLTRFSRPWLLS